MKRLIILVISVLIGFTSFLVSFSLYDYHQYNMQVNSTQTNGYKSYVLIWDNFKSLEDSQAFIQFYIQQLKNYGYQSCRNDVGLRSYDTISFCYITDTHLLNHVWLDNQDDLKPIIDESVSYHTRSKDWNHLFVPSLDKKIDIYYLGVNMEALYKPNTTSYLYAKDFLELEQFVLELNQFMNSNQFIKIQPAIYGWQVSKFIDYNALLLYVGLSISLFIVLMHDMNKQSKKISLEALEGYSRVQLSLRYYLKELILSVLVFVSVNILCTLFFVHTDIRNQIFLYKVLVVQVIGYFVILVMVAVIPLMIMTKSSTNELIKGKQNKNVEAEKIKTLNLFMTLLICLSYIQLVKQIEPRLQMSMNIERILEANEGMVKVRLYFENLSSFQEERRIVAERINQDFDAYFGRETYSLSGKRCYELSNETASKLFKQDFSVDGKYVTKQLLEENREAFQDYQVIYLKRQYIWYTSLNDEVKSESESCVIIAPFLKGAGEEFYIKSNASIKEIEEQLKQSILNSGASSTIQVRGEYLNDIIESDFQEQKILTSQIVQLFVILVTFILTTILFLSMYTKLFEKRYQVLQLEGYALNPIMLKEVIFSEIGKWLVLIYTLIQLRNYPISSVLILVLYVIVVVSFVKLNKRKGY